MKFRFNFQVSQKSDLDRAATIDRIRSILTSENKYRILEITHDKVVFDQNPWKLVWNFEAPYILDGGEFEIAIVRKDMIITLKYYIKNLYPLIIFFIIVIVLLENQDYWPILFFGSFFSITNIIQFFITKNTGKKLLALIVND